MLHCVHSGEQTKYEIRYLCLWVLILNSFCHGAIRAVRNGFACAFKRMNCFCLMCNNKQSRIVKQIRFRWWYLFLFCELTRWLRWSTASTTCNVWLFFIFFSVISSELLQIYSNPCLIDYFHRRDAFIEFDNRSKSTSYRWLWLHLYYMRQRSRSAFHFLNGNESKKSIPKNSPSLTSIACLKYARMWKCAVKFKIGHLIWYVSTASNKWIAANNWTVVSSCWCRRHHTDCSQRDTKL